MSDKVFLEGEHGIYTVTPTRGAGAGKLQYRARVWIPSQRKFAHFKAGTTLRQARRKLGVIIGDPEAALAARAKKRTEALTFDQVADLFLTNYTSRGGTGTTYYRETLSPVREYMGTRLITDITSADLEGYAKERRTLTRKKDGGRRVSDSTIRKHLICIGTLFAWAKRKKLVPVNIADSEHVKRPKETSQEARALTGDELAAVRKASGSWLDNVIGWAAETGMDKGKILRLHWTELDLEYAERSIVAGRFAMQRDKTGAPVRQVLSTGAIEVLNCASKVRRTDGIVFADADANVISEKALDWALACAYKAAGIAGCNFRTFRHTFATRALRRGVPTKVLAKMMGHSSAYITDRYQHVADDHLEAAARAMSGPERLVGGVGAGTTA